MARIRTIKPETWTSEQMMNLTMIARLAFIGLWNFCDDGGNHPASARTLKAEIFPSDEISATEVEALIVEMLEQGLLATYDAGGKSYWHVTGWHHQRIDKPTIKHPPFVPAQASGPRTISEGSSIPRGPFDDSSSVPLRPLAEVSSSALGVLGEESSNALGALAPGVEGIGEEGSRDDEEGNNSAAADSSSPSDNCPHQQIIDLFHELLPTAARVSEWTPTRQQMLRARWREKSERQHLGWWRDFFVYVSKSDFLTGRKEPAPNRPPFYLRLDWLCTSSNFLKTVEGQYENR